MKPEDFSQLLLKPGTLIGLIGSYVGASEWSHGAIIQCTLVSYVVVERHHNPYRSDYVGGWDAGAIVSSNNFLKTVGANSEEYYGDHFLLIQRVPYRSWDNQDPDVHVFGIKNGENLGEGPLLREQWEPKTIWLEGAATMIVEEPGLRSEISILWEERLKSKGQHGNL